MIYILAGPSGSGKTTQANILSQRDDFKRVITCTTRPMREGEIDEIDYFFLTVEQFEELMAKNELIAVTKYSDNYYGVPKQSLEKYVHSKTEHVVMVLDINGVKELKKIGAYCIVLTLDIDTLKERMLERGDSLENVNQRLHDGIGLKPYGDFFVDSKMPIEYNTKQIANFIKSTCIEVPHK